MSNEQLDEQPDEGAELLERVLDDSTDVLADIALMDVIEIAREAGRLVGDDRPSSSGRGADGAGLPGDGSDT